MHWQLRALLSEAGGKLESPSLEFGDDSDSVLRENMLATVSQHQRQKNQEQTVNRMRARMMNGYWVFHAPVGFKSEVVKGHGRLLLRDEPVASYIQEALEGFASGRFETQGEVKRFLESCPEIPKNFPDGTIRYEKVARIMRRVHYAGYIERPEWGVDLRKGHHEGMVSLETWQAVQERVNGATRAPVRKDINADFPLRGFVLCNDCGNPLTANWSKSKTGKKHPYYLCFTKGCESHRKSIRRDVLEEAFTDYLHELQPSETLLTLTKAMFKNVWDQRAEQAQAGMVSLKREVTKIEKQIDGLLHRIVEASMPSVISAYEKRLARLEQDKLVAQEKLGKTAEPSHSFDQLFELACAFLASPWKLWESGQLTLQRTVLKLAFAERITYCRKTGLRTPETTLPFKVLGGAEG
ncbi:recombinase [Ruegeria sp. PrR005]|uniref:Recombinase n=1 Tax=Ruegeria sp. PrR005 TaxID=2706882 RepID=A0A6B2NTK5_9RHOB|nr:recombinase [Ruegeria sp. PrR005]